MSTLIVAVLSFVGFIVAYHTYGRWLARKIFGLDKNAICPSEQLRDDVDYVPTKKGVIFGHHFTSIAGTGPIVGPAIAVFWGWLPALLWVVFGSIFIGAVHDFGALVVSLRNRGQTIGEVAGRLIGTRARVLFLLILFFSLTIVLAIFGLVIASIFHIYPESVLSVWVAMPIAVAIGFWCHKRGGQLLLPSVLALIVLYGAVYAGVYYCPIELPVGNPVIVWTLVLMAYCFAASVMPVWMLLQPRDYINSHQLVMALVLLVAGLFVAALTNPNADLFEASPALVSQYFASLTDADESVDAPIISSQLPTGALPIFPFLFITIACGACSGFHCLVSSGTSSKQVENEEDAQYVAYGSMLLEGALAVLVILACCAGISMGINHEVEIAGTETTEQVHLEGREAWLATYNPHGNWNDFNLGAKVGAFVNGGANFLASLWIPHPLAIGIIAVLVTCFAATTLDTATRLQRYVIQELAETFRIKPLTNKYAATGLAVVLGLAVACMPAAPGKAAGTGGLILWPLFGATNQLLAGLAFMVTVFYLWRRSKPVLFAAMPMLLMLLMPAIALLWQMFNGETGWLWHGKYLLFTFALGILGLQVWMVIEAAILFPRVRGVMEETLPPLPAKPIASGGRSC